MNTDDDVNEYIRKYDKIKSSDSFIHFTENIAKANEEFRTSVEPYLGTIKEISDSALTIGQKIEPLLRTQERLTDSVLSMSAIMSKTPSIDIGRFSAISEVAIQAGKSLQTIQDLTIKSSSLFKEANYDFLTNPIGSALSIASDNLALQQKNILGNLESITKPRTILSAELTGLRTTPLRISDVALGTLEESPYLFPKEITSIPAFKDPTTERIEKLEDEVRNLKEEKEQQIIIEINHEVEELLSKIDKVLLKMFKGAYAVINQNDDSLGQSAESMTRLLENLPFYLVKGFKSKENTKEGIIKEILAVYLQIKYTLVSDINHPLIIQQHYFYEIFSQIRHRNDEIYKKFEKDPARYKALLLQVEGFLYQLIKQ